MSKVTNPWFRISVTCKPELCAKILIELTKAERNNYENLNIYDCEQPAGNASQPAGDDPSPARFVPFGAPD
jgi:hypothetical protein